MSNSVTESPSDKVTVVDDGPPNYSHFPSADSSLRKPRKGVIDHVRSVMLQRALDAHRRELSYNFLVGFFWGLVLGTGAWTLGLALVWRYIA